MLIMFLGLPACCYHVQWCPSLRIQPPQKQIERILYNGCIWSWQFWQGDRDFYPRQLFCQWIRCLWILNDLIQKPWIDLANRILHPVIPKLLWKIVKSMFSISKINVQTWSQIGQSKGWLTRRNSMTPSLALRVKSELVLMCQPFITGIAQAATGLADFSTSTKHILQFPAIDSLSW